MLETLIQGWALGLATGSTCLATCSPIYLPFLLSEDRSLGKSFRIIFEISIGRFFAYLVFGALAGYIGSRYQSDNRLLFTSIAYILLSIYMVINAYRTNKDHNKCHVPKFAKLTTNAFALGILTGINFCPSFLIALSQAVDLGGSMDGMTLFLGFFAGTTLFLLPFAFISQLAKIKHFKTIAQLASILIAVFFIWKGTTGLISFKNQKITSNKRMVDVYSPETEILVIYNQENRDYFKSLSELIKKDKTDKVKFISLKEFENLDETNTSNSSYVVVYDQTLSEEYFMKVDHIAVQPGYNLASVVAHLKKFTFRTDSFVDFTIEKQDK